MRRGIKGLALLAALPLALTACSDGGDSTEFACTHQSG